jgi:hypothetical protein
VLGCISSSILLPVLQQVSLRTDVRVTMLVEASLGDALAVLAVTTLCRWKRFTMANPRHRCGAPHITEHRQKKSRSEMLQDFAQLQFQPALKKYQD